MPSKKVARTRSNYMENTTDGVRLVAGLQPIETVAHPSSSPNLMLRRKCSVNVNHLHSYRTEGSAPPLWLAPDHGNTSSDMERLESYHPVHTTRLDQYIFSLGLAEMCVDSNQTNNHSPDPLIDQNLCPVSFAERSTDSKLWDISMSGVRSAERSMELNALHSNHSDPSAFQSMSVRSAERSIESDVLNSSYSDKLAFKSMSVRPAERSIQSNELQSTDLLDFTSSDPLMSDVRPAERSIELNQLYSYHIHLHPACLSKDSSDSNVLEYSYSVQTGNFDLSISDIRSAERSLVLLS